MENDIYKIYHNNFGISFKWKNTNSVERKNKIQIVFRDMGFYLTQKEVITFYKNIYETKNAKGCSCCTYEKESRCMLLKTPCNKVDIAINKKELNQIEDLIKGTLFQLNLDQYLDSICKN